MGKRCNPSTVFANRFAADGRCDHTLYLSDTHAVTRRGRPDRYQFHVAAPRETLGKRRRYTGHILDRLLNVLATRSIMLASVPATLMPTGP